MRRLAPHFFTVLAVLSLLLCAMLCALSVEKRYPVPVGCLLVLSTAGPTAWAWALMIVTDSFDRPGGMWFNPGYLARLDQRESIPAAGPPEPGWHQ